METLKLIGVVWFGQSAESIEFGNTHTLMGEDISALAKSIVAFARRRCPLKGIPVILWV